MNDDKRVELIRSEILTGQLNRTIRKGDNPIVDAQSLKRSLDIDSRQLRM